MSLNVASFPWFTSKSFHASQSKKYLSIKHPQSATCHNLPKLEARARVVELGAVAVDGPSPIDLACRMNSLGSTRESQYHGHYQALLPEQQTQGTWSWRPCRPDPPMPFRIFLWSWSPRIKKLHCRQKMLESHPYASEQGNQPARLM
jgi:hypothetical protein